MKPAHQQILKSLLSLSLLAICAALSDFGRLPDALSSVAPHALGLAFSLNVASSVIIPALLTRLALDQRRLALDTVELIMINFAMRFYVLVLPRAASTGMRWYRYKQRGTGTDALALMVLVALFQLLVMTGAAAVFVGVERALLGWYSYWLLAVALAGAIAAIALLVPFFNASAATRIRSIVTAPWMGSLLKSRLARWWEAVEGFHGQTPARLLKILILSVASYVLFIASAYVIASSMGLALSWAAVAWVRSMVFLLTLIPITVGGVGVREASTVALLSLYGIPQHDAFAFALVMLAIQLLIGLVGLVYEVYRNIKMAAIRARQERQP